jgi:hypothetical protein
MTDQAEKMKWLDSRIDSPESHHYDRYLVWFYIDGICSLGFASWIPDDGYKSGKWGNIMFTNGNAQSEAIVLYWMKHPTRPEII